EMDRDEVAPDRKGRAYRVALGLAQRREIVALGGIDLSGGVEEGEGDRADPRTRRRIAPHAAPRDVARGQLLDDLLEREDRLAVRRVHRLADDVAVIVAEHRRRHPRRDLPSLIFQKSL